MLFIKGNSQLNASIMGSIKLAITLESPLNRTEKVQLVREQ
jgi:hypothetical protein